MNRVVLVGRITRDPELRTSNSGVSFVSFSIAVNRPFSSGEKQVDFINCVVFNKQAENLSKYVKKGYLIGIDGRIQTRNYTAQDGTKRVATDVVCDSVQFLESRSSDRSQNQGYDDYFPLDEQPISEGRPRSSHQSDSPYDEKFNRSNERNQKNNENDYDDMKDDDFGISDDDLPF